jgi:predicted ferric reductase
MSESNLAHDLDTMPRITLTMFVLVLLVVTSGVLAAVVVLPAILPGMARSLTGQDIKAYWYLSRGSAIVAYILLWLSMVLGLLMTNKIARVWPGNLAAHDLHQFVSLLGLSFVIVHSLILLGDRYMALSVSQIIVPFTTIKYRPEFVGLGQISFYLWLAVLISFYVRRKIGTHAWRVIHFASFISYLIGLIHGITSGTDSVTGWMQILYWGSSGVLLFLIVFRILNKLVTSPARAEPAQE